MSMEDAHLVELDGANACFGVFDGHGGLEVSRYAAANAMQVLNSTPGYTNGNIPVALKELFLGLDV